MHVKTGRLDHVSALAGYVHAQNDKTYVLVVIMNSEDAHRGPGQELEEAVVRWVQTRPWIAARRPESEPGAIARRAGPTARSCRRRPRACDRS